MAGRGELRRCVVVCEVEPEVVEEAADLGGEWFLEEPECARREHSRPGRGVVVGHLRGEAGAEEVWDLGQDLDVLR